MTRLKTFALAVVASLGWLAVAPVQAAIVAGDIAIIGFRSDGPDGFSFVAINSLGVGESINFWDSGFIGGGDGSGEGAGGGDWRGSENEFIWTNNTGAAIAAGTVVVVSEDTADLGGSSGNIAGLANSGDQIFAGQGAAPAANPSTYGGTLLYGIDFEGSVGWDATTDNASDSALPSALAAANIAFDEVDNGQYTGTRTVTSSAQLAALVSNPANWTTSDSSGDITLDSTDFVIVAVPEPTHLAALALLGLAFVWKRKRKLAA